jgi:ABC-type spermidine/putrescine transport system, permease component I
MNRYNPVVLIAQVSPISAILGLFLIVPIVTILIVSFWDYNEFMLLPDFVWTNYSDTLGSYVTYKTYLNTFKYTILTWFFTLAIGFPVAYFYVFM